MISFIVKNIVVLFLCFVFFIGLLFHIYEPHNNYGNNDYEYFSSYQSKDTTILPSMYPDTNSNKIISCPNLLVNENGILNLYNTNLEKSNDNPKTFFSMEDYTNYMQSLLDSGINCSVLYLQAENNTQGEKIYKIADQPTIPNNTAYDTNESTKLYSIDTLGLSNGKYADIDKLHDSTKNNSISDNPIDTNWGGVYHTQQAIDSGKYDSNEVGKPTMV